MIIRSEHYTQFEIQTWKDFIQRTLNHLREDISEYTIDYYDSELKERIERVVEASSKYELLEEQDIVCYLDAGFILGDENFPDDDQYLPIKIILQDQILSPSEKAVQTLILAFQQKIT